LIPSQQARRVVPLEVYDNRSGSCSLFLRSPNGDDPEAIQRDCCAVRDRIPCRACCNEAAKRCARPRYWIRTESLCAK
jgi:hypothetical protein